MHFGAGLHAEHYIVRVRILAAQVVRVIGQDHGNAKLALQTKEGFVNLLFEIEALVLNFKIKVAAAEDVLVLRGGRARLLVLARHQVLAQLTAQAAGKADETFRVLC